MQACQFGARILLLFSCMLEVGCNYQIMNIILHKCYLCGMYYTSVILFQKKKKNLSPDFSFNDTALSQLLRS